VIFAYQLAAYLRYHGRSFGPVAVSFAAAVATMELSVLAVLPLSFVLVWRRKEVRWGAGVLAFAGTLFVAWPGGIAKAAYAVSYGVFIMQALFRRGKYFGDATIMDGLREGFQHSPLLLGMLLVVVTAGVALYIRRIKDPVWAVFACLAGAFLGQGVLNRFHNQTYAAHFVVFLCAAFAFSASSLIRLLPARRSRYASLMLAGIVAVAGIASAVQWQGRILQEQLRRQTLSNDATKVISFAHGAIPRGAVILTNAEHEIWNLYLPENRILQTSDRDALTARGNDSLPADYWMIVNATSLKEPLPGAQELVAGRFSIQHVNVAAARR
jgi:uncharacterized membrane protein YfcA